MEAALRNALARLAGRLVRHFVETGGLRSCAALAGRPAGIGPTGLVAAARAVAGGILRIDAASAPSAPR